MSNGNLLASAHLLQQNVVTRRKKEERQRCLPLAPFADIQRLHEIKTSQNHKTKR